MRPRSVTPSRMSSPSIRPSRSTRSDPRPSNGCTPACIGRKDRLGAVGGNTSFGAISRTTSSIDGCRMTARSRRFTSPLATATATPLTARGGRFPSSMAIAAWCATSPTAASPSWPTSMRANRSTLPTMGQCTPMAAFGSPIPDTAASATTRATRAISCSKRPFIASTAAARCKR